MNLFIFAHIRLSYHSVKPVVICDANSFGFSRGFPRIVIQRNAHEKRGRRTRKREFLSSPDVDTDKWVDRWTEK